MTNINRMLAVAALAGTLMALSGQGLAQGKDKFIYGVPGPVTTAVANLTFAQELGFFDVERIDLEMVGLAGSGVIIPQLLAGKIQASGASIDPPDRGAPTRQAELPAQIRL